jgi:23S rRNA (guanine745-N1)-methyltransferase
MKVVGTESMVCPQHHTFDFTRQGYLNMTTRMVTTNYDRSLFAARRKIMGDYGFFNPVIDQIVSLIGHMRQGHTEPFYLLDMGCGEGSHLSRICELLRSKKKLSVTGIGMDLAKTGIHEAAANYPGVLWTVADLADPPLKQHTVSLILNILSPSNYQVFKQLMTKNGLLIKVVPGNDYLKELRSFFYEGTVKATYSNQEIIKNLKHHLEIREMIPIRYTRSLDRDGLKYLSRMTPLAWKMGKDRVKQWLDSGISEVTVDLMLIVAGKGKIPE